MLVVAESTGLLDKTADGLLVSTVFFSLFRGVFLYFFHFLRLVGSFLAFDYRIYQDLLPNDD
ncbi:hypothetical protein [Sphingomonas sp. PB2P12]|uniref:hypothetical protein n=1 Tax=Sphingomonas sandaracina TaxID=3096157 RepID=UPI002FCA855B